MVDVASFGYKFMNDSGRRGPILDPIGGSHSMYNGLIYGL
jgi:hypothetical protein